jgi:flagellar hook-basal body complex protein FliE
VVEVLIVNVPVNPLGSKGLPPLTQRVGGKSDGTGGETFGTALKRFVDDVNHLQTEMDTKIEKLATGEIKDVHEVMIAVDEASTAMEFMLEIRNKIVEAYQEVMRMPV